MKGRKSGMPVRDAAEKRPGAIVLDEGVPPPAPALDLPPGSPPAEAPPDGLSEAAPALTAAATVALASDPPATLVDDIDATWQRLTGRSMETAGTVWTDMVHPVDRNRARAWAAARQSGRASEVELRILNRDGHYRWCRLGHDPKPAQGDRRRCRSTIEDIHDRKSAAEALRESEERFRLAARAAGLGIWDYDAIRKVRYWSPELRHIFGLPQDAPAEPVLVRRLLHPEDRSYLDRLLLAGATRDFRHDFSATLRFRRRGESEYRWLTVTDWKTEDVDGNLARVVVVFRDITAERTLDEKLRHAATHDPLTGLPNRAMFQAELAAAVARKQGARRGVGILLLDIDHLKLTNDAFGHDVGDALLQTFAQRLAEAVREGDLVARLGGDEFAVLLPDVGSNAALSAVAERVMEQMKAPILHDGHRLHCLPSIGASRVLTRRIGMEALLKQADLALYSAKSRGRGTVVLFQPSMTRDQHQRLRQLELARAALDADRVRPFYQPKVDLASGRIVGFEALMRWRRNSGRYRSPAEIAAAFDDYRIATEIGERMIEQVLRDAQAWRRAGVAFGSVAINLDQAELQDGGFVRRFLRRLDEAGLPRDCIQVEIVESVLVSRGAEQVARSLNALSAAGIKLALDDFGTGYAALSHLQKFPVDMIKIDRSFVSGLGCGGGNHAIIDAIVGLGRSLGLQVVAEGIETRKQAAFLRGVACPLGQGFLFSPPVAARHVPRLLRAPVQAVKASDDPASVGTEDDRPG